MDKTDKNSIISQLNRLDIERLKGYRELLSFYHGQQWEGRERWGEKRLTFNYARVFIDKVTSYLMSGVSFAVDAVIQRLLSFVPDVLFVEGDKAYIVNPLSSDSAGYAYGSSHPIVEGRYKAEAFGVNRVQVEGYDPTEGKAIVVDSFAWDEIYRLYDRLRQVEDKNIDTVARAEQRGEAYLRRVEVASLSGAIIIPVNCGQQLYDVIDITDSRAGLDATRKRVLGITLVYSPKSGEYRQRLVLGGV